jgi:hypothetical protein
LHLKSVGFQVIQAIGTGRSQHLQLGSQHLETAVQLATRKAGISES